MSHALSVAQRITWPDTMTAMRYASVCRVATTNRQARTQRSLTRAYPDSIRKLGD